MIEHEKKTEVREKKILPSPEFYFLFKGNDY
jgi:hypothetical protein